MSYLKTDTSVDDKLFTDFLDITGKEFQNSPWVPKSDDVRVKNFGIFNPEKVKHDENGYPVFTPVQIEFFECWLTGYLYGHLLGLLNTGLMIAFDRFSIGKIQQSLHNKELIEYLDKQVEEVYQKHPNYRRCTREEFNKSSLFNYFMSEFRDKKAKDIAKQVGKEFIDKAIEYNLIPFILDKTFTKLDIGRVYGPINPYTKQRIVGNMVNKGTIKSLKYLFSRPLKILASRHGLSMMLGSVYEQAIMYNGTIVFIGLEWSPTGFRFVNMRVLSVKENGKLVQTPIKNPPPNLFKPSKESWATIIKRVARIPKKQIQKEMDKVGRGQN